MLYYSFDTLIKIYFFNVLCMFLNIEILKTYFYHPIKKKESNQPRGGLRSYQ